MIKQNHTTKKVFITNEKSSSKYFSIIVCVSSDKFEKNDANFVRFMGLDFSLSLNFPNNFLKRKYNFKNTSIFHTFYLSTHLFYSRYYVDREEITIFLNKKISKNTSYKLIISQKDVLEYSNHIDKKFLCFNRKEKTEKTGKIDFPYAYIEVNYQQYIVY